MSNPMTIPLCPTCGQPTTAKPSNHPNDVFSVVTCPESHKRYWVRTPITLERAESFVIPMGGHVGETFAEIDSIGGATGRGRRYLEWLAEACPSRTVRRLAQVWLEAHPLAEEPQPQAEEPNP
jgi:hypothetical protein